MAAASSASMPRRGPPRWRCSCTSPARASARRSGCTRRITSTCRTPDLHPRRQGPRRSLDHGSDGACRRARQSRAKVPRGWDRNDKKNLRVFGYASSMRAAEGMALACVRRDRLSLAARRRPSRLRPGVQRPAAGRREGRGQIRGLERHRFDAPDLHPRRGCETARFWPLFVQGSYKPKRRPALSY
jgi:hypothetical protein